MIENLEMHGTYLNEIKAIYKKPKFKTILNKKNSKNLTKTKNKTRMSTISIPI